MLAELEECGLVESELCFRLTSAGREQLAGLGASGAIGAAVGGGVRDEGC